MKLTVTKLRKNLWGWSIDSNLPTLTTHHAGGYARTKSGAENDGGIILYALEAGDSKLINAGDLITLKKEWEGRYDAEYNWVAIESQLDGQTSIKCKATHKETGKQSLGVSLVEISHIEK